jgi:hypothetical protein
MRFSMPASSRRAACPAVLALVCFSAPGEVSSLRGQEPLASWDFETTGLEEFFNPNGPQALSFCSDGVIPSGVATVDAGEVLMTNDAFVGICLLTLAPGTMVDLFGAGPRDFRLRTKVRLETVNALAIQVRARIGADVGIGQIDSLLERNYSVGLAGPGIDAAFPDGFLALGELTACHEVVPHPEWPGAAAVGFAVQAFPVTPDDWYHVEVTVTGNDDGGPVYLTAKAWLDGDDPDSCPMITVVDLDGLAHTPETLAAEAEVGVAFGSSIDFGTQVNQHCRIDDIRIDRISGCETPPVTATRTLWSPKASVEGSQAALYDPSQERSVSIALSDPRPAGPCPAPTSVSVCERVPSGWTVTRASAGGSIGEGTVSWTVDLAGGLPAPLGYDVMTDTGSGLVTFQGTVGEAAGARSFAIGGEQRAVGSAAVAPISDFGSIQHWLILGPFTPEFPGANPGVDQIARDYLTDGTVDQESVRPRAGDILIPEYGGLAASTGLAPDAFGRNPNDEPHWLEWRDLDDADDRVDFESVYGPVEQVMVHAVTYLDVEAETVVHLGVSSDDSVQILLDGEQIHINNVARGALGRVYQDTPATHPGLGNITLGAGRHVLLVKVFEGGGEHNFRVGFLDESGLEIPGGPEGVTVTLEPPTSVDPVFKRGDSDASGSLDITDGVFTLNFLFIGGPAPPCPDAADTDGSGELNITDPIAVLNYLFLGQGSPAPPGPTSCGVDPVEDALAVCVYENC